MKYKTVLFGTVYFIFILFVKFSHIALYKLNIITAIISNIAAKITRCGVKTVNENKSLKSIKAAIKIVINDTNNILLI